MFNELIALFCSWSLCSPEILPGQFNNLYTELGVDLSANQKQIRKAYFRLAHQKHPDRNSSVYAHEEFIRLGRAYSILSNPEQKRIHDNKLKQHKIKRVCCHLCL